MTLAFVQNDAVTEYPIGFEDVRRRFPNTSFPKGTENPDLTAFGVVTVHNADQPTVDSTTQRIEEGTPTFDGTQWNQVWNVVTLSAEEQQQITDNKANSIRTQRNEKLTACDWTVLTDSPLTTAKKTEWKTYRTALRDITAQSGFPHSVTWPTEPS